MVEDGFIWLDDNIGGEECRVVFCGGKEGKGGDIYLDKNQWSSNKVREQSEHVVAGETYETMFNIGSVVLRYRIKGS
jgi:hypothetical protein